MCTVRDELRAKLWFEPPQQQRQQSSHLTTVDGREERPNLRDAINGFEKQHTQCKLDDPLIEYIPAEQSAQRTKVQLRRSPFAA